MQTLRGNTCRLPGTARADSRGRGWRNLLGPNTKKIINPRGVHSPKIIDPAYCPEGIKQEVMNYITTYIY